jgi:succinate-semialdehyde dehydrogenase/glutarate-semialdehyde dehydrogenase
MSRELLSINPSTGEVLKKVAKHRPDEVEQRVSKSVEAFRRWRRVGMAERGRFMVTLADLLEARKEKYARLMTLEMGKPIRAAVQEVEKCARTCRFYAEHAEGFLAEQEVEIPGTRSFVRYQPLGTVLAIMPWNFPFWQLFRFLAPGLMAGNVGLLKHASNVPQCAVAIEAVVRDAGLPEGVFYSLLIGSEEAGKLIDDPRIKAVTLTGSVAAGESVASRAGSQIKKTVLELGGSDPFIVMPSADLDQAVITGVQARTVNNGQSCIAAKRFIIHESVAGEFERKFVEKLAALKVGDPLDPSTDIGPLATQEVRDGLREQVEKSIEMGARVLLGGKRAEGRGFFFQPTILTNIPPDAPAAREELFGPVASLFRVQNIEEAIELANDTEFGLGASAWTRDAGERETFVEEIESGSVFINGMVASDPRLPFGGVKYSGYGRELSREGIREFVNIKTVKYVESDVKESATE